MTETPDVKATDRIGTIKRQNELIAELTKALGMSTTTVSAYLDVYASENHDPGYVVKLQKRNEQHIETLAKGKANAP